MIPERKLWLDNLKAGDEICIESHGTMGNYHTITKISRITPTRKFRVNDTLFDENGEHRQGWSYSTLIKVTPEIKQGIKDRNKRYRVSKIDYSKISQEKIDQIYEIVKSDIEN